MIHRQKWKWPFWFAFRFKFRFRERQTDRPSRREDIEGATYTLDK